MPLQTIPQSVPIKPCLGISDVVVFMQKRNLPSCGDGGC